MVKTEFLYWGLDELLLEVKWNSSNISTFCYLQPCCQLKYHPENARDQKELEEDKKEKESFAEKEKDEKFGKTSFGKLRSFMWDLLEYPETSKLAQIITSTSIILIFLSTGTFLIESSFELEDDDKREL